MNRKISVAVACFVGIAEVFFGGTPATAASATAAQVLQVTPSQDGVDYDRPKPEDVPRCKISVKKIDGHVGWIVESPEGILLRKFLDTNGDNVVDQWSFYKDGVEVYRDIATKPAGKKDEFRWLNTAGTRWGVDTVGNGKLTAWKAISAEEVTAEIVAAVANRDDDRFARVLLTAEELQSLGLGKAKGEAVAAKIAKAASDFRALADRQKTITPESKWVQFSGSRPGVVPAGTDDSTRDIEVYENVVAIVQTGDKHTQVQIGTLIRVGNTWKTIDPPVDQRRRPAGGGRDGLLLPGGAGRSLGRVGGRPQRGIAKDHRRNGRHGAGRSAAGGDHPKARRSCQDARRTQHVVAAVGRYAQRGRAIRQAARRREAFAGPLGERPSGIRTRTWRPTSRSGC